MSTSENGAEADRPMLVSVVIPVFNGLPDLGEQLEGLAEQDYSGPFEVIISDNGSTDGLRAYLDRHPLTDRLRLRHIDSSASPGGPYARNAGTAAATGDFIAYTDQDDRVHAGWLSALVHAAADYDAVGGPIETETLNSSEVAAWRPTPEPEQRFTTQYLPFAHGNNIGMWRKTFDKLGGYDETMLGGGDDVDISWRIQQAGLTLGHAPEAMVAYRLRTTLRATWRQAVGYGRTSTEVYVKHRPLGCRRLPLSMTWLALLIVLRHNPLIPLTRTRIPTGLWVLHAGVLVGRIRASVRHRTFYV
ncbi:glycosyltransferase [Nocardia ninae]|uniref:Glycosyltransferase 2-like domain-containing protein n=1 Tax=Nocardia ninae NBRC 108245 TaxID=1210091 RepID=A0A511MFI4_9NOCA|nr:glycosyltransferase [Nocardia ninae]GEM39453.1 hypothetical protein NN4_39720 [Nocardia ninae NBRC 108245]